jgi:hypothetical protein
VIEHSTSLQASAPVQIEWDTNQTVRAFGDMIHSLIASGPTTFAAENFRVPPTVAVVHNLRMSGSDDRRDGKPQPGLHAAEEKFLTPERRMNFCSSSANVTISSYFSYPETLW